MTSIPASRRARAMILGPGSCPSKPGLATTTRILPLDAASTAGRDPTRHAAAGDSWWGARLRARPGLMAIGEPLSHDEGYTWLVTSSRGWHTFLDRLTAYENTPPSTTC